LKNPIAQLNKNFDNRIRLGIMSLLVVNERLSFGALKEILQITDGNLASQISALEKLKYIQVKKQFVGKKPNTTYTATKVGSKAFADHLAALELILKI